MPDPVLILGGEPRIAVAITRSLHRHGIPVSIAAFASDNAGRASRMTHESFFLPSYRQEPTASLRALMVLLEERRFDMLMPISDTALGLIADHYEVLVPLVRLACPERPVIRRVLDKNLTLHTARDCGLQVPRGYEISSLAVLDTIAHTLHFPLVAKPKDKAVESAFKVQYLKTLDELRRALAADSQFGVRNLIQEFAAGEGVGIGMLMHLGDAVAMFQHRRLAELPATGGVSVMAIAEPIDPVLSRQALSLLQAIGWEGVAMVEFKFDRRSDRAMLMEVNGRYWGSISLAVQAGVDFPFYEWQIRHGQRPRTANTYKSGMRWRWLAGDLSRLCGVVREPSRNEGPPFSKWSELAKFVVDFRPGIRSALWSLHDPGPALSELAKTLAPIVTDTAVGLVRSLLPKPVIDRLRVVRALPSQSGRIYLIRQTKRALRLHRDRTIELPSAVRSILVVCHGNIIRSPMAAALLRTRAAGLTPLALEVSCAGTHASAGAPADPRAIVAARELGIDLRSHRAQRLTRALVQQADLVIGMDFVNEATIIAAAPEAAKKTVLLGAFGDARGIPSLEVGDPYAGELADVRRCYAALDTCVTRLARELLAHSVQHEGTFASPGPECPEQPFEALRPDATTRRPSRT
jgi:protein-tyrosine-phosphatase/predicted ATP-grasp superfamily ATP-dependent carboligase